MRGNSDENQNKISVYKSLIRILSLKKLRADRPNGRSKRGAKFALCADFLHIFVCRVRINSTFAAPVYQSTGIACKPNQIKFEINLCAHSISCKRSLIFIRLDKQFFNFVIYQS